MVEETEWSPWIPGSSASEDLTESWKSTFAVPAQPDLGTKPAECADKDGDGFLDADKLR